MFNISLRYRVAIIVLLFFFLLSFTPGLRGFGSDMDTWRDWTHYIYNNGLCNAYNSRTNYTPLFQYFMWLFSLLQNGNEGIEHYIGYLRLFSLLFEFIGLWLVWEWLGRKTDYLAILLISLFNVGYSYNTLFWGQVDSIMPAFVFAALLLLYREKPVLSGIMMVLALNMKLQALPFLPLWGLLLLQHFVLRGGWLRLAGVLIAMLLTQGLLVLPFAFGNGGLEKMWHTIVDIPGTFPAISMNAYNIWYWIVPDLNQSIIETVGSIAGIPYLQFGLMCFCLSALAAFIPLFIAIAKQWRQKAAGAVMPLSRDLIWLTAAQVTILFFFFNTRMHERYTHPAFLFLTAYAFHTRRFGLLALFSLAYFLNLERVMTWYELPKYSTLIFDPGFVAGLYALVISGIYFRLYQLMRRDRLMDVPAPA